MKKILMTEAQVKSNILSGGGNGITTGHLALKEMPGFNEKCEEIGRLLGMSTNTTLNGEIVLHNENMSVVLGVDEGDGSRFYRPTIFAHSISMFFLTSDPAGYEAARASFDKLMKVMGNSELTTL